jgi:hypothetical protein
MLIISMIASLGWRVTGMEGRDYVLVPVDERVISLPTTTFYVLGPLGVIFGSDYLCRLTDKFDLRLRDDGEFRVSSIRCGMV